MSEEQAVTHSGVTTRRALLAGAGAIGTTAVLAACGTDPDEDTSSSGDTQSNGGSDPSAGAGDTGGGALTQTGQVPVGGGTIIAASSVVVTQPTAGEFKCFSSTCTHQGCPVTGVEGGTINCNCHGSKFSITDGSVKGGPATKPLAEKQIKVDGDSITLV
ncbi:Rieske (2Fe-2S) protein [Phytohabitans suffuscus]|uniref:Cytochrome bc1 complex Rieske iron-sulfur subunit n=1 Tax=Phytohabitans suffuscus TaxID=624315 RepID=A0A6F8YBQ3_9ACTN|nr:Rieske (2Fe-2S) protein [Phytohabitans suffuscus]BCB83453.1 iron-sulfur protein [Phytohabitans suffuscus]